LRSIKTKFVNNLFCIDHILYFQFFILGIVPIIATIILGNGTDLTEVKKIFQIPNHLIRIFKHHIIFLRFPGVFGAIFLTSLVGSCS